MTWKLIKSTPPCIVNFETQEVIHIPDMRNKIFLQSGAGNQPKFSHWPYFDTLAEFRESLETEAIILCYVLKVEAVKKRIKCDLLTYCGQYSFFNVESIGEKWIPNELPAGPGGALIYFVKNEGAVNDVIIKAVKMLGNIGGRGKTES